MKSYVFSTPVDMLTFEFTQFLDFGTAKVTPTDITVVDTNGDVANFVGHGFFVDTKTKTLNGTATGLTLTQGGKIVLKGSSLNLSANRIYLDHTNNADLIRDFFGGGVSITGAASANSTAKDILVGGSGADRINANGGADTLIGGPGADTLIGSAKANDLFLYRSVLDSTPTAPDEIVNFHGGDKINLLSVDKTALGSEEFKISATGGKTGDLTISYNKTTKLTTILLYDNNSGKPAAEIRLTGDHANLTYANFIGVAAPTKPAIASAQRFVSDMAGFGSTPVSAVESGSHANTSMASTLLAPRLAQA